MYRCVTSKFELHDEWCSCVECQTFMTLSLSDMANRVQLSGPREAEKYILNMVG